MKSKTPWTISKPQAEKMLQCARKFVLAERIRILPNAQVEVAIEWRSDDNWIILIDGMELLTKAGDLLIEPSPSNRTEKFIKETRYSFEEAWNIAEKFVSEEKHKL